MGNFLCSLCNMLRKIIRIFRSVLKYSFSKYDSFILKHKLEGFLEIHWHDLENYNLIIWLVTGYFWMARACIHQKLFIQVLVSVPTGGVMRHFSNPWLNIMKELMQKFWNLGKHMYSYEHWDNNMCLGAYA